MTKNVWAQFLTVANLPEPEIDLGKAAFLLAASEKPDVDVELQMGLLDSLASAASIRLGRNPEPLTAINNLSQYLFDELGFVGNRDNYYDPNNSFLDEVLRRRSGIPITLSLVYIETAARLDIPLLGVGMPGHFLVRHRDIEDLIIDPFEFGILLSEEECADRLRQVLGESIPWRSSYLDPINRIDYIARIVGNLKGSYLRMRDYPRALRMYEWLLSLPEPSATDQRERGVLWLRLGDYGKALIDLQDCLHTAPDSPEADAVQELIDHVRRRMAR